MDSRRINEDIECIVCGMNLYSVYIDRIEQRKKERKKSMESFGKWRMERMKEIAKERGEVSEQYEEVGGKRDSQSSSSLSIFNRITKST